MALEVKIPKDINEYKDKLLFGLSVRQLLSLIVSVVVGVGIYMFTTKVINMSVSISGYFVMILVMPFFAFGFVKKNGQNLEDYLKIIMKYTFSSHKRLYSTELNISRLERLEAGEVKKHGTKRSTRKGYDSREPNIYRYIKSKDARKASGKTRRQTKRKTEAAG